MKNLILIIVLVLNVYLPVVFGAFHKKLVITDDFGGVLQCKTVQDINHFSAILLSAKPDIIALDAASPDICNYPTKAGFFHIDENHQNLFSSGVDPWAVVAKRITDANITFVANFRMNDHHGQPEAWTQWEQAHKEWSLGKDTGDRSWKAVGMLRRMDYAIEGVRQYRFEIVKEAVDHYPINGVQLDFGRTAPFLSEPKKEKAKYLTEFVAQVRNYLNLQAKNLDRKMILGVIVPWDIQFCSDEGLEIRSWVKQGLIDYICPGEFYYMEYNMPISNWHSLIEGTQCELFPMLLGDMAPIRIQPKWVFQKGNMLLLGEDSHLTPARISAAAELFYSQNADGLSLYNFYTYNFAKLYPDLRDFTEPICLKNKQRQYFFCHKVHYEATEDYNFKFGKPFEHLQLSKIGQSVKYVFNFGSELTNTTSNLRFKIKNYQPADELTVFLNGRKIVPNKIENTQFTDREGQAYSVGCWESNSAARNLKLGQNEIKLTLNKNDPARQLPLGIWELEIFISPVR